jgi:MFS family permease
MMPQQPSEDAGKLDVMGLALVATGLVGVTYGLAESGGAGSLASSRVLEPLIAGLVLITLFVIRALKIEKPLLDVRLFANRAFAAASLTTFCLGAALFGAMILMPLYFQTVRGEDAVHTGLLLAPQGIGAAFAMGLSGRVTERFGGGLTALFGGVITILATIPFVIIGGHTSYWLISAAMVVRGFGIGMSMMPSMTAAFSVLKPEEVRHATPQLTVLQRVGGSIGTAILSVVLQGRIDSIAGRPDATALASAFGYTYWWVMGVTLVALVPTVILAVIERRARQGRSASAAQLQPAETSALEAAA